MKVASFEDFASLEAKKEEPTGSGSALTKPNAEGDRRAYSRLDARLQIRYKIFKSKEELLKRGYTPEHLSVTSNISAGGLLFVSHQAIPVSAILELAIELPDGQGTIECLSRVLRIKEIKANETYDIAVCFLDITSAQRVKLDKYVEKKLKE